MLISNLNQSWQFYRKQPVLNAIVLWLFVIPFSVIDAFWLITPTIKEGSVLELLLGIVGILFGLWAEASILVIAKRMIGRSAGRMRSSFNAVTKQAKNFIIPILLTEILWFCKTALWGLLLIVPGIITGSRRFFFPIVIVSEGKLYKDALKESAKTVRGQTGTALLAIIGILALCGIPLLLSHMAMEAVRDTYGIIALLPAIVMKNSIWGYALLTYELCIVSTYAKLKHA